MKAELTAGPQPAVRRLGSRLHHLYQWALAAGPFADIWDLCCDHGRLGLHLYQSHLTEPACARCQVHLVDCVPHIIDDLKNRYAHWEGEYLAINCRDSGETDLPGGGRQLVMVAGVSGGTIVNIIARLLRAERHGRTEPIEFMLSPNRNAFELRGFLREHNFELLQEEFVTENGWHHEHLHLRLHATGGDFDRPDPVGTRLWHPLTPAKIDYLKSRVVHYRKGAERGGHASARAAMNAYQRLLCEV